MSKQLTQEEIERLKATLRGFLNNTLQKYPKAGPGILRKLWTELPEERFGSPLKRDRT